MLQNTHIRAVCSREREWKKCYWKHIAMSHGMLFITRRVHFDDALTFLECTVLHLDRIVFALRHFIFHPLFNHVHIVIIIIWKLQNARAQRKWNTNLYFIYTHRTNVGMYALCTLDMNAVLKYLPFKYNDIITKIPRKKQTTTVFGE